MFSLFVVYFFFVSSAFFCLQFWRFLFCCQQMCTRVHFHRHCKCTGPKSLWSYFWDHHHFQGYSIAYLWNIITVYSLGFCSLAIDSLFSWLVCNIVAQFGILMQRFQQAAAATERAPPTALNAESNNIALNQAQELAIVNCIKFHNRTLKLANELSLVYGGIIFVKFLVSGIQICCLAFCLCRGTQSKATLAYQCLFLSAVALQLILYCYNGQRITDEVCN